MENIQTKELTEEEYKKLKVKLNVRQKRKRTALNFVRLLTMIVTSVSSYFMIQDYNYHIHTVLLVIYSLVIGGTFSILASLYFRMATEMSDGIIQQKILEYELINVQEDVKSDLFENSLNMSYKYLDQYYLQTREQAQRGFFVTVCVAVFGAVLIGIGIVAMFLGKTSPSYVTCASGVITEFIAAVFFYLYNRTVTSMSKYHNKLVISQNISIALKVADSLTDNDKVNAKNIIITELLKDVNSYLIKGDLESK